MAANAVRFLSDIVFNPSKGNDGSDSQAWTYMVEHAMNNSLCAGQLDSEDYEQIINALKEVESKGVGYVKDVVYQLLPKYWRLYELLDKPDTCEAWIERHIENAAKLNPTNPSVDPKYLKLRETDSSHWEVWEFNKVLNKWYRVNSAAITKSLTKDEFDDYTTNHNFEYTGHSEPFDPTWMIK